MFKQLNPIVWKLWLAVIIFLSSPPADATLHDWSYGSHKGPHYWPKIKGTKCDGRQQSPINLHGATAIVDKKFGHIKFHRYNITPSHGEWKLENNGHSVKMSGEFAHDGEPSIVGGGLPSQYQFLQLHFHWGEYHNPGSEHLIDGKRYPAEMHLVHMRRDFVLSKSNDWKHEPESLAVIGVMIELSDTDNPDFEPIIGALKRIRSFNAHTRVSGVKLKSLLPHKKKMDFDFFRYDGGLTTPDCNEIVVWTVLHQTVKLSWDQLHEFQRLSSTHSNYRGPKQYIRNNFRPAQLINSRDVWTNTPYRGAATTATISSAICAWVLLYHCLRKV